MKMCVPADEYLHIEFSECCSKDFTNHKKLEAPVSSDFLPLANSEVFYAPLVNANLLTKGDDVKTVFQLCINSKGIDYEFCPGDTIGILPSNADSDVNNLIQILQLEEVADLEYSISILQNTKKRNALLPKHIPKSGTIRNLLLKNLDLRSPPKKTFLRRLAKYATSANDREQLIHICTPQGSQDYLNLIAAQGQTLLGLLQAFSSCKPSVSTLLEHLPALKPRPYSISSSPLIADEFCITFSVVVHKDGSKGVCSGWLETLARNMCTLPNVAKLKGEKGTTPYSIPFYFRKPTKFRLPTSPQIPIILIGPGTGVSAFVSFLQHRYLLHKNTGADFGIAWLFFGCRYSSRDYLYQNEFVQFLRNDILTRLFTSFSRDGCEKNYVQYNIKQCAGEFVNMLINEHASVYICGDAKNMAKDVRSAIISVLSENSEFSKESAEQFLCKLEKDGKYIQDIWI